MVGVKSLVVLTVFLFAAIANAAFPMVVSPVPSSNNVGVQQMSAWYFLSSTVPPAEPFQVTITEATGTCTFYPNTLNFDPQTDAASFRMLCTSNVLISMIYTLVGNTSNGITVPSSSLLIPALRTIAIEALPNSLSVNMPSEPKQISLPYPSAGDLTFILSSTASNLMFEPAQVTIPAGSMAAPFVVWSNSTGNNGFQTLSVIIMGDEAMLYTYPNATSYVSTSARTVAISTMPANVLLGDNSTISYAYIIDQVNSSFSLVPQAADTTFNPPSFDFTPDGPRMIPFTFNSTSANAAGNARKVYFTIADPTETDYVSPPVASLNVPYKVITVVVPDLYFQNKQAHLSLCTSAPVISDLTVTFYAGNLFFNQSSVTFNGTTTCLLVDVMPIAYGGDMINYKLSGSDAAYYSPIPASPITVTTATFFIPPLAILPLFWLGVTSDQIAIRANVAPTTNVTLTLVSPDLTFNPSTLTFTAGALEQYFTITPNFTSTAISGLVTNTATISFIVGGGDWSIFTKPQDLTVTVQRRSFQIVWSPDLTLNANGYLNLYLLKTYNVWATANYVDSPVTVTPYSPYMDFNPPVLSFTSSNLQVKFSVTIKSAAGNLQHITWLIGGQNGGLYTTIPTSVVNLNMRTITFGSAVIAPDTRIPANLGAYVTNPQASDLGANHVYSFGLTSTVIPDQSVTITPMSKHITFSPTSITLNSPSLAKTVYTTEVIENTIFLLPGLNLWANFSVTPLSAGRHEVWFVVSGPDAAGYSAIPHTYLSFSLDDYPAPASAASSLFASLSTSFIAAILAFFSM